MEAILNTFGIDWRLLAINMANFGILLFVLWYFLYGPVMRMLEERRKKVAEGVRAAEAAQQKLHEIEASRAAVLAEAGKEADQIVHEARSAATKKEKEILAQGESAAAALLNEASMQAEDLKNQALRESKEEVAKLVVLGMEKVMAKK